MDRLKILRKQKNLTQSEIAKILNIATSTYVHYELGKRQPDFQTLKNIADFFNVSIDYLLEYEKKIDDKEEELTEILNKDVDKLFEVDENNPRFQELKKIATEKGLFKREMTNKEYLNIISALVEKLKNNIE